MHHHKERIKNYWNCYWKNYKATTQVCYGFLSIVKPENDRGEELQAQRRIQYWNCLEYNIKIEFISFKSIDLNRNLTETQILGSFSLVEDAAQLNEVIIRAEKIYREIKLDKSVQCRTRHACKRRNS
jgi:hypothetical protein